MALKRGQSGLSGLIVIDKPAGMTSHDVVSCCRRIFGEKRVGHAGTLDPAATGMLLVGVGSATRLSHYLSSASKSYEARIVFGAETNTDDLEGSITRTAAVPDEVGDPFFAAGFLDSLHGDHEQVPPAFSAIKVGGKVAYKEARKGKELSLAPRPITVYDAVLLGVDVDAEIAWNVLFSVSKGTYIRALARDIGRAVDSAAHLGALRRVTTNGLTIHNAITLEQLEQMAEEADDLSDLFIDPTEALGIAVREVSSEDAVRIEQGKTLAYVDEEREGVTPQSRSRAATGGLAKDDAASMFEGTHPFPFSSLIALTSGGKLLAVYRLEGDELKPDAIFAGGVSGVR